MGWLKQIGKQVGKGLIADAVEKAHRPRLHGIDQARPLHKIPQPRAMTS